MLMLPKSPDEFITMIIFLIMIMALLVMAETIKALLKGDEKEDE